MENSSFPSSGFASEAMSSKVAIILSLLAVARAGIIGTDFSPATAVSYSSISPLNTIETTKLQKVISAPVVYSKTYAQSPFYDSVLSTQEKKLKNADGSEQIIYSKSLNRAYADIKKYEPHITNGNGYPQIPTIYSTALHENPYVYHPATYNYATPVVHAVSTPTLTKSISVPITYATHSIPLTKTKTTVLENTKVLGPLYGNTKIATTGLSAYATHDPVLLSQPVKTIAYSDAPVVSHMTFSGLGASYSW